ncbi:hypothetical protein GF324_08010 [bacterium]|nr:hypothetical protein [bacterium]
MKRSLPFILTLGNLAAGLAAVAYALQGAFFVAGALVLIGAVLDGYDGRLARKLGVAGVSGQWADTTSDLVTFGLAPSMMLFMLGGATYAWLFALFYAAAILARLVRYLLSPPPAGTFKGLPSPSAGIAVAASVVFAYQSGMAGFAWGAGVLWGALAVSTLPYPGLFHPALWILPKGVAIFLWGGHLIALGFHPSLAVLSFFSIYTILGPILFTRWRRNRETGRVESIAPEGDGTP